MNTKKPVFDHFAMSSPLPRCRESCQSLRDCRGFLFVNGTDLLPARDAETLSTPVQIYISKKELRSWSSEKKIPEDQGVDPPSITICFCGIIGKRKSWTVRHLAARFLTEICLHQGYCKVQVLLFSFLTWQTEYNKYYWQRDKNTTFAKYHHPHSCSRV